MPISLICIYRSPGTDSDNFITSLGKVIDGLNTNIELTVITGDMNVNIIGIHEYNNKYLNMLSESVFIFFINVYTRLSKGVKYSCLDHIFINSNDNVKSKINAGVILTDKTDHCSVCVSIPTNDNFVNNQKMLNKINYKYYKY